MEDSRVEASINTGRRGRAAGSWWRNPAVDFAVVVLGILVALGIDEWRQSRIENELEHRTLVQLRIEFAESIDELEQRIVQETRLEESARKLVNYAHDPSIDASPDSIAQWFTHTGTDLPLLLADGTVRSLVMSGGLWILRSDSLRSHLAKTVVSMDDELELIATLDADFYRYLSEPYFTSNIGWFQIYTPEMKRDRRLSLVTPFPVEWSRLRLDRAFGSFTTRLFLVKRNRLGALQRLRGNFSRALRSIEADLLDE